MDATMSRTAARTVQCPACGAEPGEHCRRTRGGQREQNHRERVEAAEAATRAAVLGRWTDYDASMTGAVE